MSINPDPRQRAMLEHMGLRLDFLPPRSVPVPPVSPGPRPAAALAASPPPDANRSPPVTQGRSAAPLRAPELPAQGLAKRPDVAQADWALLQQSVRECQACGLCQTRRQTVFGMGAAPPVSADLAGIDLLIVGEAPGEQEDLQGLPFVGAAGQLLDQMLAAVGWSRQPEGGPAGRVFIANVLKCRPPGNRNPQAEEVAQCLPYLQRQIELLRPRLLLAMGRIGAQALLTDILPDGHGMPLGKLRGQAYDYRGTPLVVTYHPAYLLRSPAEKSKAWVDLCLARSLLPEPRMGA